MGEYNVYRGLIPRIAVGILMLSLFLAGGATAATHTVCPGGCTYSSIQGAINAAISGDIIEVKSGTYFENVNVIKRLTLRGIGMPVVDAGGSGSAIKLAADGIVLEGFTAKGTASTLEAGINIRSNNNTIIGNNADSNTLGIFLNSSDFNNVNGNNISNSSNVGIKVYDTSKNNNISGNKVTNSSFGIFFVYSFNTTASYNIMENNSFNFGVGGNLQSHFDGNNIDTTNLANGRPIYYIKYGKNTIYDGSTRASTFYCVLCNNVTLKDLEISNMDRGVYFWSTSNSRIQNITVKESGWGLYLRMSSNNSIRNSKFSTNNIGDYYETGVTLFSSNNNTFEKNNFISNNFGIELYSSTKNTIYNNYFNNTNNFVFTGTAYANTWNTTLKPGKNIVGGPYLGGNFWDNPSGTGFSQTCPDINDNKICDLQNFLNPNNIDHLPLVFNATTISIGPVHNINKGTNYTTIQDAIDDASPGNEIHVDSGTYYENVNVTKRLTLRGIGMPVVNAVGYESPIMLSANGIILEGFNVTGGSFLSGVGIKVVSNSNMLIGNKACFIGSSSYPGTGIDLSSSSNNTLIGNNASNNHIGINLFSSSNNNLTGNNANSNYGLYDPFYFSSFGIDLYFSNNNTLIGNNANSNDNGIFLTSSRNNTLIGNNVNSNNGDGISLYNSSKSVFKNNIMNGNKYNFGSGGISDTDFDNQIDITNLVDGKPIYYMKGSKDAVYDSNSNAGTFFCINCVNVTLKNLDLKTNVNGIFFWNTTYSKIQNVTASNNGGGIILSNSSNNMLNGNTANSNYGSVGISLSSSNNNTLNGNTANSNSGEVYFSGGFYGSGSGFGSGIILSSSNNNTLMGNTANLNYGYGEGSGNSEGFGSGSGSGIYLSLSSNNTLNNNIADSNYGHGKGIGMGSGHGVGSGFGIYLSQSSNNKIYGNTANSNYGHGEGSGYSGLGEGSGSGIYLSSSYNNMIGSNNVNSNYGNGTVSGPPGYLGSVSGSGNGISLGTSSNNTLLGNNASNNSYGISMDSSSNNTIYNNIFNNTLNIQFTGLNLDTWNTKKQPGTNIIGGHYLAGNFWANPNGTGFSQTCADTDRDGICESAYILDANNTDHLPLVFNMTTSTIGQVHNINKGTNYTSIQIAIDDANPGDEIHVDSGTYYENVNVTRQLTLRGESNLTTIIDGNGSGHVVEVNANGFVIDGFRIRNGSNGIYVNSSNSVFSNNVILDMNGVQGEDNGGTGGMSSGIYLSNSTDNSIRGNTISNITGGNGGYSGSGALSSGVYLSNSLNNTFTYNTINNISGGAGGMYGADQEGYGIYLWNNSYQNLIHTTNTMDGNPIIYLYGAKGAVIENYVLTANSNPTNLGKIVLINSNNSIIKNNTISNMKVGLSIDISSGIYLSGSTNIKLTGNNVSNIIGGTGGSGVWIKDPYDPYNQGKYLGGSGGLSSGIYLHNSPNNTITGNTITNITGGSGQSTGCPWCTGGLGGLSSGIYLSDSPNNIVTGNAITYLTGGIGGDAYDNPGDGGSGGGSSGIYLSESLGNTLADNTISYLKGGTGGWGKYDVMTGGHGGSGGMSSGIYLSSSQNSTVRRNIISNITGADGTDGIRWGAGSGGDSSGVYLSVSSNNSLEDNIINIMTGGAGGNSIEDGGSGGHSSGIILSSSSNNAVAGNNIRYLRGGSGENGEYWGGSGGNSIGIYISDSTNGNLTNNTINDTLGGTGRAGEWIDDPILGGQRYVGGSGGTSSGIYLYSSPNITIAGNTITNIMGGSGEMAQNIHDTGGQGGHSSGIYQSMSVNNTIRDNTIINIIGGSGGTGNEIFVTGGVGGLSSGIYLFDSQNNTLTGNAINYLTGGIGGHTLLSGWSGNGGSGGDSSGIYLSRSPSNTLEGNTIGYLTGGTGGMGKYDVQSGGSGGSGGTSTGISLSGSQNNKVVTNIIVNITGADGTDGSGWTGNGGKGGDSSGIYISVSPNNTIASNLISIMKGGAGAQSEGSESVSGSGGHSSGILFSSSPNNAVAGNTISYLRGGSGESGEWAGSGGNSIGISISNSTNSNLSGNAISDTIGGTGGTGYDYFNGYHNGSNGLAAGVSLSTSDNNRLGKNIMTLNNDYGIYLIQSSNNTLSSNNASNNSAGISLSSSINNTIYNNILNNTINIQLAGINIDTWNTTKQPGTNIIGGHYLAGNFWANPNGTGFSQTCADTDRDGICDSTYIIDANNTDFLPLSMNFTSDSMLADMFGVNNHTGAPNTFVLVPVNITNTRNGPIAGIVFDVSFDPGIINLTKIRVQKGSLTSSWDSPGFNPINGRISLVYGGAGTEIPDGSSGTVVILNFSVVGASGSKSAINISRIQLSDPDGIMGTAPSMNGTFSVSLKGDLNDNGEPADAGDLVLMKRASIGEIPADFRYDMNNNGELADAGDLVLMKRASIGEIILSMSLQGALSSTMQPNATDFGVNDVSGNPDTYVLVPVNITNSQNGPIAGIIFDVSFDPGIINLTKTHVQKGDLISEWDSPSFNPINGRISLVFGGDGTEIPDGASGSVVILNFTVIGASGSRSAINISRIQLSNVDGIVGTAPSRNGTFTINQLSDNIPPVAVCGPDNLKCENVGAPVQFNGSASYDPDGAIASYYWDFGDGINSTDAAPKHTYASYKWNGTAYQPFTVNLTVTDNSGLTNSTSQKVVIWMAGDANGDGKVNILDASVVGLKWGTNDPCADLNNDGVVNILDASIIGLNWGKLASYISP